MIRNVYFVQNLHGIQYFLSLYEPEQSNLIAMSDEKSLHQFLQDIMPNERKIVVPRVPFERLPLRRHAFRRLVHFCLWRIRYTGLLREVLPLAKAYFFGSGGSIHFFILLGYLSRRGVEIKYVDAHSAHFHQERIESPHFSSRLYLWFLSTMAGIRLTRYRTRYWDYLGLANWVEPVTYRPDSWDHLAMKYGWTFQNESQNAILLIDGPIQSFNNIGAGVNIEETQRNLVCYFSELLNKGIQIHLKPHYDAEGVNSFSGTSLEKKVRILPESFPVELIMNAYQEVYFFCSVSGSTPIQGKKYSLANLVVFNSEERKDLFRKLCEDDFGEEITKVEFITIPQVTVDLSHDVAKWVNSHWSKQKLSQFVENAIREEMAKQYGQ